MRPKATAALAASLLLAALTSAQDVAPVATPTSTAPVASPTVARGLELRGMCVPMHVPDPAHDYGASLAELPPLGVSHVAIFVRLYQPDGASPAPARHPLRSPGDEAIRRTVEQARAEGLEVALVPMLLLERPEPEEWRGNIRPPSWERWFAGYRRELLHLARLAEHAGVTTLAVGSELSTAEGQTERWLRLIADVRAEFTGALTYSANWDHYRDVPFWAALDYIGLSGYYELTTEQPPGDDPGQDTLLEAWRRQRRLLTGWRKQKGLRAPLLFLELGYESKDGCAARPWDYTRRGGVDLEEQRRCYAAFAEAWRGAPELAGVFFYEWWGEGGARDASYTPRGKPALEVVRELFGGEPLAQQE
jgi:hypothetical protein